MTHFTKTYKTPDELVHLLLLRGLLIKDTRRAERYIQNIGYYRLSAYMYPFLKSPKSDHLFKDGTTFDKVLMLYRFDKKLRVLLYERHDSSLDNSCRRQAQNILQHLYH